MEITLEDSLGIPHATKTAKTTKKLRKAIIREILTTQGPINRPQLIERFHCSDRALRNDFAEIAEEKEAEQAAKMKVLRDRCTDNLMTKAAADTLPDKLQVAIVLSGEAKQIELTEEVTLNKNVNINVKSMLAEYEHLITTARTETTTVPANNPA